MASTSSIEFNVPAAPSNETPAQDASNDIATQLCDLESTLARLEKRLGRVLRPHDTDPSDAPPVPASVNSEHVADLRRHADYIASLERRVIGLLSRLDV